jgi:hypothetical protein
LAVWAVDRLGELRDPGSFDLYVLQLGRDHRRPVFNQLVYQVGGRTSIPADDEAPAADDAQAVAEHSAILQAGLASTDIEQVRGALYALWTLEDRPWARSPQLLAGVAALLAPPVEDAVTRRFAAMVLKAQPAPPETHEALLAAALGDEDRQVRRHAVEAVGRTGAKDLGPQLLPALEAPFGEVRREASLALSRLGVHVPIDRLEEIYRNDEAALKGDVLELIAQRPGKRATALLLEGLRINSPTTRAAAVAGLAVRPGDDPRRGLEDALQDEERWIRVAAANALAAREDGAMAAPGLVAALREAEAWQEVSAFHTALTQLTGHQVPAPTYPSDTWPAAIEAWSRYLDGGSQ